MAVLMFLAGIYHHIGSDAQAQTSLVFAAAAVIVVKVGLTVYMIRIVNGIRRIGCESRYRGTQGGVPRGSIRPTPNPPG